MKIILDTNVFMSGIFWSGTPAKILEAWYNNKIELVLSKDILDEYDQVGMILSKKYRGVAVNDIIELLIMKAKIYEVASLGISICRDPKDDMFIACAIAARVNIIVSGDADLLEISGYQNIQIMKPRYFCDKYLSQ